MDAIFNELATKEGAIMAINLVTPMTLGVVTSTAMLLLETSFHQNLKVLMISYLALIFILNSYFEAKILSFNLVIQPVAECEHFLNEIFMKYSRMTAILMLSVPAIISTDIVMLRCYYRKMNFSIKTFILNIFISILYSVVFWDIYSVYTDDKFQLEVTYIVCVPELQTPRILLSILRVLGIIIGLYNILLNLLFDASIEENSVTIKREKGEYFLSTRFSSLMVRAQLFIFATFSTFLVALKHHGSYLFNDDTEKLKLFRFYILIIVPPLILLVEFVTLSCIFKSEYKKPVNAEKKAT